MIIILLNLTAYSFHIIMYNITNNFILFINNLARKFIYKLTKVILLYYNNGPLFQRPIYRIKLLKIGLL